MKWEIKSLNNNFQVVDLNNDDKPVIVGYDGNKEKVLYISVGNNEFLRSDSEAEKEDQLTIEDLKLNKFDEIPTELISEFISLSSDKDNKALEDNNSDEIQSSDNIEKASNLIKIKMV